MLKPVLFCNYEGGEEKREGKGEKGTGEGSKGNEGEGLGSPKYFGIETPLVETCFVL